MTQAAPGEKHSFSSLTSIAESSGKHRQTPATSGSDDDKPKSLLNRVSVLPFCNNLDETVDEEQQPDASKYFHGSSPYGKESMK
jgi:hypothetical protein